MGPNKAVHLVFLSGGLILFFLLNWTGDWVLGYFTRHPNEFVIDALSAALALTIGIVLYRNERVYGLANEVTTELKKVTWPTRKETQTATLVVIVTVIISAVILGLGFDTFWAFLTDRVYG
jgi:preprotein translocase SecE subunit